MVKLASVAIYTPPKSTPSADMSSPWGKDGRPPGATLLRLSGPPLVTGETEECGLTSSHNPCADGGLANRFVEGQDDLGVGMTVPTEGVSGDGFRVVNKSMNGASIVNKSTSASVMSKSTSGGEYECSESGDERYSVAPQQPHASKRVPSNRKRGRKGSSGCLIKHYPSIIFLQFSV
jgi:hypothetical protein